MKEGWVSIYRQLMDSPLWLNEPFTRGQAWVDLILLANHTEHTFFYKRGVKIDLTRGQVGVSEVGLSDRWKWSRNKVRKFLNDLEKEQQIKQQKNNVTQIITILNYDKYQKKEQQKVHQKVQQEDTFNNENNENKYLRAKNFYKTELEKSNSNPLFDQFIKILFGESGAGTRCDGILEMEQQVTWVQFQILVDKAKAKGIKLSDLIYDFENGRYYIGKKSLYLSINNWINKR